MPAPVRTLLVGTLIATTTFAGAATSQTLPSTIDNDQVQYGDVLADGTLDVVDVGDQVVAATTATGNGLSGAVENVPLRLTSRQELQADVRAGQTLTAGQIGGATTVVAAAVGNTGAASAYNAQMGAEVTQVAGPGTVRAETTIDTPHGRYLGGAGVSTTALSNTQAFGVRQGRADYTVQQTVGGRTEAVTSATVQYVPAPAAFTTSAVANSVSAAGQVAAQDATVVQRVGGASQTRATTLVAAGNAWNLAGAATATANTVSISNQGGSLDVLTDQGNAGLVRAQSTVSAYDFGLGSAQALGVGNTAMVGNNDVLAVIDTTQVNTGGVEATADFTGNGGYDAYASATAMGNAATGYACAECAGVLQATNRQINDADITAASSITITGSNRNVTAATTAVGNSASYYVSSPGG